MYKTNVFEQLEKGQLRSPAGEPLARLDHLAALLGYSAEYLARLRSGNADVTPKFLGRLIAAFGPTAATWVWEEGQEPPATPIPGVREVQAPDTSDPGDVVRYEGELSEAVAG